MRSGLPSSSSSLRPVRTARAGGHERTLQECLEGSDFIANAAFSRDNGVTREASLNASSTTSA
jgi:hypothetical protein